MYYLTMNKKGLTNLWEKEPVYFDEEGEWSRVHSSIVNSTFLAWPRLKNYALALGLKPGPKGIMEVDVEIKERTGEVWR